MRLLLDTHIWIWVHLAPERISRRVRQAIESAADDLWLSPVSIWELIVLAERRRIALNEDAGAWIVQALRALPLREAPFTSDVALASREIRLPHRDPADVLLAATAQAFDLTLVTSDERLVGCKQIAVLANR
jgi:PIN domain nuclease of toxin-antitoxin system